jgi:RNA polymerase sigma-70 factor (sigma-E family)
MQGNGGSGRQNDVPDSALPLDALVPVAPGSDDGLEPEKQPEVDQPLTFAELYRTAYTDMVRLAFLLTGSAETARDLVQDSYLRVHGAWGRVAEPRAYLRRAVVNACNSHHRRTRRQRQHAATTRVEPVAFEAEEMADAIAALPYRQRAAIVLRFWHDCTEAEIAAALGCRPGTVGSLIHRALAELRKVIP